MRNRLNQGIRRLGRALTCAAALLSSCAAPSDGDEVLAADEALVADSPRPHVCGNKYYEQDGAVVARPEWYSFRKINQRLAADPTLRTVTGLERVNTCRDARLYVSRSAEYIESLPAVSNPSEASADTYEVERKVAPTDKILNGTQSRGWGVVRLNFVGFGSCTGVVISSRAILTAAHCVPPNKLVIDGDGDGVNDTGAMQIQINYDRPNETTTYCLNARTAAAGNSTCPSTVHAVNMYAHPDFVLGQASNDIALLVHQQDVRWRGPAGTSTSDWAWLNFAGLAAGHDFWAWGAGGNALGGTPFQLPSGKWIESQQNSNILRNGALADLNWLGTRHFFHEGRQVRICNGDSGGPAFESIMVSVAGLAIDADYTTDATFADPIPACAEQGVKQRWTRVSDKIGWIGSKLSAFGQNCNGRSLFMGMEARTCRTP